MNPTDSSRGTINSPASAVQPVHGNRYGHAEEDRRSGMKTPICEKLNYSMKNMMCRLLLIAVITLFFSGAGFTWMQVSGIPVEGPQATTFSITVLALTVCSAAVAGIVLLSAAIKATLVGKQNGQIEQLQKGNYLARWDLDQEQWSKHIDDEMQKTNEAILPAVTILVFLGLALWYPFSGVLSPIACIAGIIGMGVFGLLIGVMVRAIKNFRLKQMTRPLFTIVGCDGLYFHETYYPYKTSGSGLDSVKRSSTQSMEYLVFTFYQQTKEVRTEHERRVPVPFGKEHEADWLMKKLS